MAGGHRPRVLRTCSFDRLRPSIALVEATRVRFVRSSRAGRSGSRGATSDDQQLGRSLIFAGDGVDANILGGAQEPLLNPGIGSEFNLDLPLFGLGSNASLAKE